MFCLTRKSRRRSHRGKNVLTGIWKPTTRPADHDRKNGNGQLITTFGDVVYNIQDLQFHPQFDIEGGRFFYINITSAKE